MPFDLVVPVWWGSHPAWGVRLLESLTFEAIRMALETGSLHDDVRLTFNAERAAEKLEEYTDAGPNDGARRNIFITKRRRRILLSDPGQVHQF